MASEMNPISFKWEKDEYDEFRRTLSRLKAEGELDPGVTRSEAMRKILENWAENPDPSPVTS